MIVNGRLIWPSLLIPCSHRCGRTTTSANDPAFHFKSHIKIRILRQPHHICVEVTVQAKKTTLEITSINLLPNSALQICTHSFFVLASPDKSRRAKLTRTPNQEITDLTAFEYSAKNTDFRRERAHCMHA
jgi:hypothetical protein